MSLAATTHVFVGPTLAREAVLEVLPTACLHPPVAHGAITDHCRSGDTVLIIDGLFHESAAIRHKELLSALRRGVRIVGSSSMGALRAAEMAPVGMVGSGTVFDYYAGGRTDADDEVAVVHSSPEESWRQLTVPVVAVRHVTSRLVEQGTIDRDEADALLAVTREVNYRRRTPTTLRKALLGSGIPASTVERLMTGLLTDDVKRSDALATLEMVAASETWAPPRVPEQCGTYCGRDCGTRETHFQTVWRFRAENIHGVDKATLMHAAQLFSRHFVDNLYAVALQLVSQDAPDRSGDLQRDALAAAEGRGLLGPDWRVSPDPPRAISGFLGARDRAEWHRPGARTAVALRGLVRSCRVPPGIPPTHLAFDSVADPELARLAKLCAAAYAYNTAEAERDLRRQPHRVRDDLASAFITRLWGVADSATAFDHGFISVAAAVRAAKFFVPAALAGRLPLVARYRPAANDA